jgi:transposase
MARKSEKSECSPYMTLKEAARHFRVSESSIRKGCGVFAMLRITTTDLEPGRKRGRKLVLRESVERVDALLQERAAASAAPLRLAKKSA